MSDLKLPAEWEVIDDVAVMDPDGWDRKNYDESWNTPICREEWILRMRQSTVARPLRSWKKVPA